MTLADIDLRNSYIAVQSPDSTGNAQSLSICTVAKVADNITADQVVVGNAVGFKGDPKVIVVFTDEFAVTYWFIPYEVVIFIMSSLP